VILALGRRALAGEELADVFDEMLGAVERALAPDLISLLELLPGGPIGVLRTARGWPAAKARLLDVADGTPGALALREGRPVVVEDFGEDGACRWPDPLREEGVLSGVVVPIAGPGPDPGGLLAVHWRAPRRIAAAEVALVDSLAFVVDGCLHRERAARAAADGLRRARAARKRPAATGDASGGTVTLGEGAEALGVSASTLRRWAQRGRIRSVRTAGGHRRFAVAEVSRVIAARGPAPRRGVQPISAPAVRLGRLAGLLEARGAELAAASARVLYRGGATGWFAEQGTDGAVERWIWSLASAARSGNYALADACTVALGRQAEMAGATLLERHSFVETFGAAVLRALAPCGLDRAERAAVRRLFVSLRQKLLAAAGHPA
jgi:excisionase family DNA binding protein